MKPLLRWLKRRRHRARREERLVELENLGFELIRDREVVVKKYFLRAPDGQLLDNGGMGWVSSAEAYSAAKKLAAARSGNAGGDPKVSA